MENQQQSRRLRKKNNTHKAILHSAKTLFEQKGIDKTTIDEISEHADVSRSTFFNHFGSVDELLEEIASQEINDMLEAAVASDKGFPLRSMLFRLVDDTFPYPYLTGELLMRGILSKKDNSFKEIDLYLQKSITERSGFKGLSEQFSPKELSAILMGVYYGLIFQKFIYKEDFSSDFEIKESINKFITFLKNY
ncbi:MAG TPA: TetR/AcrR family transcriptional regulator [Candidatus Faecicola pullistercoris]|nr:TetR/AcrR family transcriptional regulator [Candidatus Faecicola pullistercoris]